MKNLDRRLASKLGYKVEKIKLYKSTNLMSVSCVVDLFQYANLSSKHIRGFKEKLIKKKYLLKKYNCPICQSKEFTTVASSSEGLKWGVCKECGLMQSYCRLRNKDVNDFYESGEYQAICMDDLADEIHFDLEYKVMGRHFIEIFKSMSVAPSEVKIMEIGCGSGGILLALKEWGVDLFQGYDIDEYRVSYGKNFINELEVADALLFNPIVYKEYNYILLSNILEHLTNPLEFLSKLSDQLDSSETKVIIDVPNLETCADYSDSFSKFLHIGHIWYFNSISIERLLNQSGMEIISIYPGNASFTVICSKSDKEIVNTNNSYWNSISSISYANYING